MKRGLFHLVIVFLILSLPVVISQTVVSQPAQPEKKSMWSVFDFLKQGWFWWIVIGFIIIVLILVGIFFLVRWIVQFFKNKNDLFQQLKTERMSLAKIQRRYPSKSWLKVQKNTPIRLVKRDENGIPKVSPPIAYHRGDFTTSEGNVIISMNLKNKKKFWILPITDLLIIPNKEEMTFTTRDRDGKASMTTVKNLPKVKDIVQFNEEEILIYAESFSNAGMFYVPVIIAKDGKVIDLTLPVFQSLKEVIIGDYLYRQSTDFVDLSKKAVDMNPVLRFNMKSADSNASTEIPQGEQR